MSINLKQGCKELKVLGVSVEWKVLAAFSSRIYLSISRSAHRTPNFTNPES